MKGVLPVAITWHMHQPYYKHPQTSEFVLPWVRLHASKDYLHMARLAQEFPGVKVNFTMVPSLRDQLDDYAQGAEDEDIRLTLRTVEAELEPEEKRHMLSRFFSIHYSNVIERHDEYRRLLQVASAAQGRAELLSDEYFVDLALWFNLAWLDPDDIAGDERLTELKDKGTGYTRDDVRYVLQRQRMVASGVPHLYRRLERDGQVELLTVPYYHPILPLLIDTNSALRADPHAVAPDPPFQFGEDAAYQLTEAVAAHRRVFGKRPRGVWPSEGAISPEAADAIAGAGLEWFASDEGVLARSVGMEFHRDDIGSVLEPAVLYRPYRLRHGGAAIFRVRVLSDRIGFAYGTMSPHEAVGEMIWKLERARERLPDDGGPYLASIVLDGENAWEGYPNNGNDFLRRLYGTLEADKRFETVRVSDYLEKNPPTTELPQLHSGSWIDANYRVWIGEESHARAWSALERTRSFAQRQWGALSDMPPSVRRPLLVAEGSDWFWWYSSRNSSREDAVFDSLFRANLEVIWWFAGSEPPDELRRPLLEPARVAEEAVPRGGTMLPGAEDKGEPAGG
jgi:alpha-amylase/alpha-mannosidase (GH57 family)